MDPNGNYMGNFGIPFANYGGIYFPVYNNEMETEADLRYMKEMYPIAAKGIQALVERELDRMDMEGSIIYDEYPDRVQILRIVGRIYDQAIRNGNLMNNGMNDRNNGMETNRISDMESSPAGNEGNNYQSPWGQCQGENCRDRRLEDFIYVILLHEIFKRRTSRRNNNRRYW